MSLLLDTHALIWWLVDDPKLAPGVRAAIIDPRTQVFVSVASAWEIAIKAGLGRLELGGPRKDVLPDAIERDAFHLLAISIDHALAVEGLPHHHRDPFDRMLICQARAEGLTLITADKAFAAYDVVTMDARR